MKSLKNYKYKVFNKEHKLIAEIGRVFQAVSNYDIIEQRDKVDQGLSLITNYQEQIDKLKQRSLKTDMYV
tara:strand:- start:619 stop:828 length:210 start_codon:yes stop_codon:yes gene_type:complete